MYGIKKNGEIEIYIKKSKFIGKTYSVYSENEAEEILRKERMRYKDATHACYGYVLENISKASDDGEPAGTAGLPILNILQKNNLSFTLCIVIRYFGGIKLGVGGLIRSYSKCAKEAIARSEIIPLKKGKKMELDFTYENHKNVDFLLQECIIEDKKFTEYITYIIEIEDTVWDSLEKKLRNITTNIRIIDSIYMK